MWGFSTPTSHQNPVTTTTISRPYLKVGITTPRCLGTRTEYLSSDPVDGVADSHRYPVNLDCYATPLRVDNVPQDVLHFPEQSLGRPGHFIGVLRCCNGLLSSFLI
jgi:hypothetical protein